MVFLKTKTEMPPDVFKGIIDAYAEDIYIESDKIPEAFAAKKESYAVEILAERDKVAHVAQLLVDARKETESVDVLKKYAAETVVDLKKSFA